MSDDDARDAKCPECQATQKRFEEISLKFAAAVVDWEDDDTTIRDLCLPIIGDRLTYGDGHFTPPLDEVVRKTIHKLREGKP